MDHFYHDKCPRFTLNIQERIVIIEVIVTEPHELVSQALSKCISDSIDRMGLKKVLRDTGRAQVTSTTSAKEPDGSFKLVREKWPTIAIETGLSEHRSKLAIDAHWWLEAEESRTLVVITAKIDQRRPQIIFQRWEHYYPPLRPITRHYYPTSTVIQEVHAVHEGGITRATGDLVIPFEKMFRRPRDGREENDTVIGRDVLADIAESAWESQGFM
ncbi:hypothetical protein MaudCBS49596_006926 [Microsporum audouinii]